MTRNDGAKLSLAPRDSQMESIYGFLSNDKHAQLCEQQGSLRREIGELNRRISRTKGTKTTLVEKRDELVIEWERINEILAAASQSARENRTRRLDRLSSQGIATRLSDAKTKIQQLKEAAGGNWTNEERLLCADLKYLAGAQSPLVDMVRTSDIEQIRKECARDVQLTQAAAQLATEQLKIQIRDLQARRSNAAQVLARIYESRYEEVDRFRIGRGVTHRIHLTAEDCQQIEEALLGG